MNTNSYSSSDRKLNSSTSAALTGADLQRLRSRTGISKRSRRRQCAHCEKRVTTYERPDVNFPAIVIVTIVTIILVKGISESASFNALMVMIKVGVLVLFIVIGVSAFQADHFANFFGAGFVGVSAAAGTIFFSFIGLDAVATAGEEVKDPQKALTRR